MTISKGEIKQMPNQPIKLPNVEYEMLSSMAKSKNHREIEAYLLKLINSNYGRK